MRVEQVREASGGIQRRTVAARGGQRLVAQVDAVQDPAGIPGIGDAGAPGAVGRGREVSIRGPPSILSRPGRSPSVQALFGE